MTDAPEVIAGRYEIVQALDAGGMGMVHRAYDTVLDRVVAVKRIRYEPDSGTDARVELAARFRREARVTAKIDHPGVPVVYDAAIDGGRLFLVMQLIEGISLFDLLNEHDGLLPVDWAVAIAAQIATVLSYAHAVPVVHRDLKPRNIMIAQDGSVKVLDFGIAAVLRTDVTKITMTGGVIGTHGYMSPEQIRGGGVSPRSDLYGLGCLLHELLAGKRPFDHENTYELMRLHVSEPPLPVRTHAQRREIPEELERLVLALLEKDPQQRPADAQSVHARLAPFLPPRATAGNTRSKALWPDPTKPYRTPLAPRGRQSAQQPVTVVERVSEAELVAAHDHALQLVDKGRFTQAAEVLSAVIEQAPGRREPAVLEARLTRAVALFLGSDYRRALPEFLFLAEALAPDDERMLECRRQAAYCRAELGDIPAALRDFRALLADILPHRGNREGLVLEVRKQIGFLLPSVGEASEAEQELGSVLPDLIAVYGPDNPEVNEVRTALTRLRASE